MTSRRHILCRNGIDDVYYYYYCYYYYLIIIITVSTINIVVITDNLSNLISSTKINRLKVSQSSERKVV